MSRPLTYAQRVRAGEDMPEPDLDAPCGDKIAYWQTRARRSGYRHGYRMAYLHAGAAVCVWTLLDIAYRAAF